jgi:hypothetical protein
MTRAPYNAGYANDVRFDVMDGANLLATVVANLQQQPNDFTDLGEGGSNLAISKFHPGS